MRERENKPAAVSVGANVKIPNKESAKAGFLQTFIKRVFSLGDIVPSSPGM